MYCAPRIPWRCSRVGGGEPRSSSALHRLQVPICVWMYSTTSIRYVLRSLEGAVQIPDLLARLQGVQGGNGAWKARCPAHDDHIPSLSVTAGRDGRVMLHCHAGCNTSAVVAATGIEWRDLFPEVSPNGVSKSKIVAEYRYHDEKGVHVFDVVRKEPKGFFQRSANGTLSMKGVRLVPYRLQHVITAVNADQPIFVVEGEKDADALAELGLVATTNAGGAGKWKAEYSAYFRGAHVVILPDNDEAGRSHAADVARHLISVAKDVRIVELPGLAPKGDVSDWLCAGGVEADMREFVSMAAALAAPPSPAHVAPASALPPSSARSLRSWLEDPALLVAPALIIPHLAVEGRVTLLSGREKIGKSTLVACAVAAASRGEPVLGVTLGAPIRTLWYALDEPVADAVRRFNTLGADLDAIIINDTPRNTNELLLAIEADTTEFSGIRLVVVDTLSKILAITGVNPNNSHEVEPVIAKFADVFHKKNVAAILLYHTGKGGLEYRGSTAIGATVDEVLTLRRRGQKADVDDFEDEEKDDGRRLLIQDGRNLRGRLQLTCADGVYRPYDNAVPVRSRAVDVLRLHGSVKNRSELAKLVGGRKAVALEAIAGLIADGTIHETSKRLSFLSVSSQQKKAKGSEPPHDPSTDILPFPSSGEFPEAGTEPEPLLEQAVTTVSPLSSRFETPPLQKREPEPEKLI